MSSGARSAHRSCVPSIRGSAPKNLASVPCTSADSATGAPSRTERANSHRRASPGRVDGNILFVFPLSIERGTDCDGLSEPARWCYVERMTKTLTLKRSSPLDLIYIPVTVADTAITRAGEIVAELDTGNDHTCIRRDVLATIGISAAGRALSVHGVTGSATGTLAKLFLGFKMDDGHQCKINNHEVVVLETMSCHCLLGRDILRIFDVELRKDGTTILKYG